MFVSPSGGVDAVYPEASGEEVEELVESGDLSAAMAVKMRVTGVRRARQQKKRRERKPRAMRKKTPHVHRRY